MNDKLKGIIVCGVVVACLGATLGVLKLTGVDTSDEDEEDSSEESTSSEEEDESVQLIDVETDDIAQIYVTNEYGSFTYVGESESGKDAAGIAELEGLTLSTAAVSDIGEDTAQLTAYKLAEEDATDLSKYGLDNPASTFEITFRDDTQRTFMIGDNANQNRYRYVYEEGTTDVYMVLETTMTAFLERKEDLLDTTLLASSSDDEDEIDFGVLTVSRADLDYDMVFEQDDGSYEKSNENMPSAQVMTSPIFSYLNGTTSSDIIFSLYGLTAIEAEVIFPDEEDLAEYGLDDPIVTVTFVGDDYDYTLLIGNEYHELNDEGEEQSEASAYYCTFSGVDGHDCIWKIDASSLPWVDLEPTDVVTTLMTWNMVVDVTEINITGDETVDIDITSEVVEDEDDSDDDDEEEDKEVTAVEIDGEEVDVELFKSLYEYILSCPTTEVWFEDPDEEDSYLTLDIVTEDGGGDTLEFYKDTERRTIVKLNGATSYRIQSKWVDRLLSNVEAVKNGEDVEDDY
ncbi:MAG: DUF4340 domain-containing protein [Ruminococcus sp.]|nr:DUF4340 domain-containing protein [Ruminococcus sp.]